MMAACGELIISLKALNTQKPEHTARTFAPVFLAYFTRRYADILKSPFNNIFGFDAVLVNYLPAATAGRLRVTA